MLLPQFLTIMDSKVFSRFYTNRSCTTENFPYKRNVSNIMVPTLLDYKDLFFKKFLQTPADDNISLLGSISWWSTWQHKNIMNSVTTVNEFKVCKSVHHHTIPINQPTRCNNFPSLLLDIYVRLDMFRASSRPSSGAQQLQ